MPVEAPTKWPSFHIVMRQYDVHLFNWIPYCSYMQYCYRYDEDFDEFNIRIYLETYLPRSLAEIKHLLRLPTYRHYIVPAEGRLQVCDPVTIANYYDLWPISSRGTQGVNLNFVTNADRWIDEEFYDL